MPQLPGVAEVVPILAARSGINEGEICAQERHGASHVRTFRASRTWSLINFFTIVVPYGLVTVNVRLPFAGLLGMIVIVFVPGPARICMERLTVLLHVRLDVSVAPVGSRSATVIQPNVLPVTCTVTDCSDTPSNTTIATFLAVVIVTTLMPMAMSR